MTEPQGRGSKDPEILPLLQEFAAGAAKVFENAVDLYNEALAVATRDVVHQLAEAKLGRLPADTPMGALNIVEAEERG